jgi:hypothetical protein
MWELLLNGLNIAGSFAGLSSFASGFSIERDLRQIKDSIGKLEELQSRLLESSRTNSIVIDKVGPMITDFQKVDNHAQNVNSMQILERYVRSLHSDLTKSTNSILSEALSEMKKVIDSYRYTQSESVQIPKNLLRDIVHEPFRLNVRDLEDITQGGLLAHPRQRYMNHTATPLTWCNPLNGQSFCGEIPLSVLRGYGLRVHPPSYRYSADGHIYSDKYGLYLPSYLVAMA